MTNVKKLERELKGCEQPFQVAVEEAATIDTEKYRIVYPVVGCEYVWVIPFKHDSIRARLEAAKLREENEKLLPLKDVARRLGELQSEIDEYRDQSETIESLKKELEALTKRFESKRQDVISLRQDLKYVHSEKSALSRQIAMEHLMRDRVVS